MMKDDRQEPTAGEEEVARKIERDASRKLRGRSEGRKGVWFGFGMFGLVGWSIAVPTVLGLALGLWIDAGYPSRVSWTLTFLVSGVALGCLNAWYWIRQEGRIR